jgi:hypothetical protein
MWLSGKFEGDNVKNVIWDCGICHVKIRKKKEAISHVRNGHGSGTIYPKLSKIGKDLAKIYFYNDASDRLAKALINLTEHHFCKGMGAEPIFVNENSLSERSIKRFESIEDFISTIEKILIQIRQRVEQQQGYITLTTKKENNRVPRSEKEIQVAIYDWLEPKCKYMNIDITREAHTGRGSVDFKLSYGNDLCCFIEIKILESPDFKHGVEVQLPTYLQSKNINHGFYVLISTNPSTYEERIQAINNKINKIKSSYNISIKSIDIQAWKKTPASKADKVNDPNRYSISN